MRSKTHKIKIRKSMKFQKEEYNNQINYRKNRLNKTHKYCHLQNRSGI